MKHLSLILFAAAILSVSACARLSQVGQTPDLTSPANGNEVFAMNVVPLPDSRDIPDRAEGASLWTAGRASLLGDRRASLRGDILTVVIEIDDSAEFQNSSERERSGSEEMGIPNLFGLPQRADGLLTRGGSLGEAVEFDSSSRSAGEGSVRRNEELTLRVAATITEVLQNGVLRIEGSQEVRVNNEVRELLVTGYVRPEDISRQNSVEYDRIAAARISYGGRGLITDVQRPRYGQEVADAILPF
ncbi:flagellar basal body L-ring protein FlgH [Hasllibacter sp. MH4015]|uniref:flagellar basal body L-ring protein FlgH n=1 Tax=Hasllibacter sp. MH4015 TaxID=2854029 RepID=UPI001CD4D421|nr:flagellar basal body L-ring protein FlgH [Hasllibacter sp. MH4015]